MTVQVDEVGPGVPSWKSSRFKVKVDGITAFVYGYTRSVAYHTRVWSQYSNVEQSWVNFGADTTALAIVSLEDGSPITSAEVYPRGKAESTIIDGNLILSMPEGAMLRVEVNGDGANTLQITSSPLKDVPTSPVNWTDRVKEVTLSPNTINLTAHGITSARVIVRTDGDMPSLNAGEWLPYKPVTAISSGPDTLSLRDDDGVDIEFDSDGTGVFTLAEVDFDDENNTLYFGPGEHHIGTKFRLGHNTTVYFDAGAIVYGTFDLRARDVGGTLTGTSGQGILIHGPGTLSGSFIRREDLPPGDELDFVMFDNYGLLPSTAQDYKNCELRSVWVVAQPYHFDRIGSFWRLDNVKILAPWWWTSDGPNLSAARAADDERVEMVNCLVFSGDDGCKMERQRGTRHVEGCFFQSVSNSSISFSYWPKELGHNNYPVVVRDNDFLHIGLEDLSIMPIPDSEPNIVGAKIGSRSIIKALTDGWDGTEGNPDQTTFGMNYVTVEDNRVWGPCNVRPFVLGNLLYPFWGEGNQRNRNGNMHHWVINGFTMEYAPKQKPLIIAKDAQNTPHDITITGMQFGNVALNENNFRNYWFVSDQVYNLVIGEPEAEVVSEISKIRLPSVPRDNLTLSPGDVLIDSVARSTKTVTRIISGSRVELEHVSRGYTRRDYADIAPLLRDIAAKKIRRV